MAGGMQTNGTEELMRMLGKLGDKAQDVASGALYEGAKVVADAYRAAANSIKTAPRKHKEHGKRLPTPAEKAVASKLGVSRFRKSTLDVNTMVGAADGYAEMNGKQKPIRLIARSINSGTSFMQKQPVFRKASAGSQGAAQDAMVAKADQMINEIMNNGG